MKVTISFTPGEFEQASRVQAVLLGMFERCRIHSSQNDKRCIIYLTFHF